MLHKPYDAGLVDEKRLCQTVKLHLRCRSAYYLWSLLFGKVNKSFPETIFLPKRLECEVAYDDMIK